MGRQRGGQSCLDPGVDVRKGAYRHRKEGFYGGQCSRVGGWKYNKLEDPLPRRPDSGLVQQMPKNWGNPRVESS